MVSGAASSGAFEDVETLKLQKKTRFIQEIKTHYS